MASHRDLWLELPRIRRRTAENSNPQDLRCHKRARTEPLGIWSYSRSIAGKKYNLHSLPVEVFQQIMHYLASNNYNDYPLSKPPFSPSFLYLAETCQHVRRLIRPFLISDYQCVEDLVNARDEIQFLLARHHLIRLYELQAGSLRRFFLYDSISMGALNAHRDWKNVTCYKSYTFRSRFIDSCFEATRILASTLPKLTYVSLGAVDYMATIHPQIAHYIALLMKSSQESLQVLWVTGYGIMADITRTICFRNLRVLVLNSCVHFSSFQLQFSRAFVNLRKLALIRFQSLPKSLWPSFRGVREPCWPKLENLYLSTVTPTLLPFMKNSLSDRYQNLKTLHLVCSDFSSIIPLFSRISHSPELYLGYDGKWSKLLSKPSAILKKKLKGILKVNLRPSDFRVLSEMEALEKLSMEFSHNHDLAFCRAMERLPKLKQLQILISFPRREISFSRYSKVISRIVTAVSSCKSLEGLVVVKPFLDFYSILTVLCSLGERLKVFSADIDKWKCTRSECHIDLFAAAVKYNPNLKVLHIGTKLPLDAHITDLRDEYEAAINRTQRFLKKCMLGPVHVDREFKLGLTHFMDM